MAVAYTLEFEKPLQELDRQIEDLRKLATERGLEVGDEVRLLETRLASLRKDLYKSLTPMQRVLVAR
ncbi:MAG TPA: acetyl-CoA carboxylase carboxyl transferase subunit alpha, partial [Gemmatimonadales bacterium]